MANGGGGRSRTGERRSWSDSERLAMLETDMDYSDRRWKEIKDSQDRQNRILIGILVTLIGVGATYLLQILTNTNPPPG